MSDGINETHDPELKSWVESANRPNCDFPIQNLPLGVFRTRTDPRSRLGVAIGEFVLDIRDWLEGDTLNGYTSLTAVQRSDIRRELSKALRTGSPTRELFAQSDCEMLLPASIGDYTDFYASIDHATNVGKLFRPDHPLLPNYKHVPIAYHGRASSIVVSGTPIRRPNGQLGQGRFGATEELDYELELAAFLGPGNPMGQPIPIAAAEQHVAGVCLLNDWSARDIQRWEYQPLGPFLGKNFATSISAWMVTLDALEPFRVAQPVHESPELPYLRGVQKAAFDITVEVWLRPSGSKDAFRVSRGSFRDMYWSLAQMVAHHASNGCPLRAADVAASGTVSGPERENCGCLLELTSNGRDPLLLPDGTKRRFLENGDEVILTAYCLRDGFRRIGFGTCEGEIVATWASV